MTPIFRYCVMLPPRTKKNHQEIRYKNVRGRRVPFISQSEVYKTYEKGAGWFLRPVPGKPIDVPVRIVCRFYRATRARMDLTNALEAIDDILVRYGIIADDNCDILVSHDGSRVLYDKENPRTEIEIYLED